MEYLFNKWREIIDKLKDKYLFLFLDYDGTLTRIVKMPEKAIISQRTKNLLEKLSENPKCKISIISGRGLQDIKNKVGLKNIIYVGNHGLEIEGTKIKFESTALKNYRTITKNIKNELAQRLSGIKGVILEDKGFSLAIHFRLVDKNQIHQVKAIVYETTMIYTVRNKIKIQSGKMLLEIKPPLCWDKGKVALWLLARQKFALKEKGLLPFYIGDDKTDEDAFRALRNRGITIFVGKPNVSNAQYYLKNTKEVRQFLSQINKFLLKS